MPLTYERRCSSVASVHCRTRSSRRPSSLVSVNGTSWTGFAPRSRDDPLQVVDEPLVCSKTDLLLRGFVFEGDLQPFVQVAGHFEAFLDDGGVELDFRKDCRRRDGSTRSCRVPRAGPDLLEGADRLALLEAHFPLRAVAFDGGDEFLRQRVDHARADAVQAAGGLVTAVLELAASVEHGEDHFERALLRRRDVCRPGRRGRRPRWSWMSRRRGA